MNSTRSIRLVVFAVVGILAATMIAPVASYASSTSSRNIAIGLGALSAYLLLNGKTTPGLISAAGAAYMYNKSQQQKNDEKYGNWERDRYYGQRYSSRDRDQGRYSRDSHRNSDRSRDYGHDRNVGYSYNNHRGQRR